VLCDIPSAISPSNAIGIGPDRTFFLFMSDDNECRCEQNVLLRDAAPSMKMAKNGCFDVILCRSSGWFIA
jgi:hypothetical protein